MIIYLAGFSTIYHSYSDWLESLAQDVDVLTSYWDIRFFDGHTLKHDGRSLFIDSGAFSAQRDSVNIDVRDYGKFLKKYGGQCNYYANLDSIPKAPTEKARLEAARLTLVNQEYLEQEGLTPSPVYHKGEPIEYLDQYVATHDHICIGGLVDTGDEAGLDDFFASIWKRMVDDQGKPKLKVHGFGMTNFTLMHKYPWYSADSTSWLIQSRLGWITMPRRKADGWDYNSKPQQVSVSNDSYAKMVLDKHYESMNQSRKDIIDLWLKEMNLDIEYMREHPVARFFANVFYWVQVVKNASWSTTFVDKEFQLL